MTKPVDCVRPFLIVILILILSSCASSRKQDGFSYKPAYSAPDMGSGEETIRENSVASSSPEQLSSQPMQSLKMAALEDGQKSQLDEVLHLSLEQIQSHPDIDFRTNVRSIAISYTGKNQEHLHEKQLKKLDKLSARLEKMKKKQEGPDVSWGPSNNLEWAILGAAAVGLFVGIFGAGFGWFVFLVAALAYLYFKLLHKN